MNCFECAKTQVDVVAVGLCQHCGVGLCLDHLIEAHEHHVGGTMFGCPHTLPDDVEPLHGPPAGILRSRRRQSAGAT